MDSLKDLNDKILRIEKCKRSTEDKLFCKTYLRLLMNQMEDSDHEFTDNFLIECQRMNQLNLEYSKKKSTANYYEVTVNLPHTDLPDKDYIKSLQVQVEKYVRRVFVKLFMYSFEYYTDGDNHLHCHILIYTAGSISDSDIQKYTRNTFYKLEKIYTGFNSADIHIMHISKVKEDNVNEKIDYIRGIKNSPGKKINTAKDNEWKEMLSIPQYVECEQGFGYLTPTSLLV